MTLRQINMSKQVCKYCKATGHRIHVMNKYGEYLISEIGSRILACPVLIQKSLEDFPPLCAIKSDSKVWTETVTTNLSSSILSSKKDRKAKEREALLKRKEERKKYNEENHSKKMEQKYGPHWHRVVENTKEDCEIAESIRYKDDVEREAQEWEEYCIEAKEWEEFEKREEKYKREKAEIYAIMSTEEIQKEEEYEEEDAHNWVESRSFDWNNGLIKFQSNQINEKAEFERNGWIWKPF